MLTRPPRADDAPGLGGTESSAARGSRARHREATATDGRIGRNDAKPIGLDVSDMPVARRNASSMLMRLPRGDDAPSPGDPESNAATGSRARNRETTDTGGRLDPIDPRTNGLDVSDMPVARRSASPTLTRPPRDDDAPGPGGTESSAVTGSRARYREATTGSKTDLKPIEPDVSDMPTSPSGSAAATRPPAGHGDAPGFTRASSRAAMVRFSKYGEASPRPASA